MAANSPALSFSVKHGLQVVYNSVQYAVYGTCKDMYLKW